MATKTKWRNNKEPFLNKINNNPKPNLENFANIPMFDVINNGNTSTTAEEKPKIIEGMDMSNIGKGTDAFAMFLDDYFIGCKRTVKFMQSNGIGIIFQTIFKNAFNPIYELDKAVENILFDLFNIFLKFDSPKCNNDSAPTAPTLPADPQGTTPSTGFTWSNTTIKTKLGFTTREPFENSNIRNTVKLFKKNHQWINNENIANAVGDFYVEQVNKYETRLHRRATPSELLIFNNRFDDSLNGAELKAYILKKAKVSKPKSSDSAEDVFIADSNDNWENFISKNARFLINNKTEIQYYPFDGCFPIPKDIESFNSILANTVLANQKELYTGGFTDYKQVIKSIADISKKDNSLVMFDIVEYIHSSKIKKEPIHKYLVNIVRNFTYLYIDTFKPTTIYNASGGLNLKLFYLYEAYIATLYIKIVNYIEYQLYRLFKLRLNVCELSVINAVFYGLLVSKDNPSSKNINELTGYILQILSEMIPSDMIQKSMKDESCKLIKNAVTGEYVMITVLKNYVGESTKDASIFDQYARFIDSLNKPNSVAPTSIITSNPYSDAKYKIKIDVYISKGVEEIEPNIRTFFLPKYLNECETNMRKSKQEYKRYASTLKMELYKILVVPICIFVAYNFYYIFFFKDCATPTKIVDDDGNVTYKNECDECFNPIFPDWEGYFRYFDKKHRTDYFFEFLFKPVKLIYTCLNAFKTIFRKYINVFGINFLPKDQAPYIFFLFMVYLVYSFVWFNFSTVSDYIGKLAQMENPALDYIQSSFKGYAFIITLIAFAFSAVKNIFGPSWDILAIIKDGLLDKDNMPPPDPDAEPAPDSWVKWISASTGPVFGGLKFIYMLIYWGLKYYITFAVLPMALFICSIYLLWNLFFGLYNNTKEGTTMFDKIELMQRVMYSKLYIDTAKPKLTFKTIIKYMFWFILFFLFEFSAGFILLTSMQNFSQNIQATQLKTFLIIFYMCLLTALGLWCFYKFYKYVSSVNAEYVEPRPSPDTGVNKRIEIVKNADIANNIDNICKDNYEKESSNQVKMVFLNSDNLNYKLINEYMKKKPDTNKKTNSGWGKWLSKKASGVTDYVAKKQEEWKQNAETDRQVREAMMRDFKKIPGPAQGPVPYQSPVPDQVAQTPISDQVSQDQSPIPDQVAQDQSPIPDQVAQDQRPIPDQVSQDQVAQGQSPISNPIVK